MTFGENFGNLYDGLYSSNIDSFDIVESGDHNDHILHELKVKSDVAICSEKSDGFYFRCSLVGMWIS